MSVDDRRAAAVTFLLAALTVCLAGSARAQAPLLVGIDHIPIVVDDLERAQHDFRAMGFAIKPGRPHADGIRNAHVKFPDGTELELITAPASVDALTTEYRAKLQSGDGPVYFCIYAPDHAALMTRLRALHAAVQQDDGALTFPAGDPLHHLFFGLREKAATDRPEHFAHANTARRVSGLWVRGNAEERALLQGLGAPLRPMHVCGPMGGDADVAELPEGDVTLVRAGPADGGVIGARVDVKSLAALAATLKKNGLQAQSYPDCGQASLWLPPAAAHGVWLQFVQAQ